MSHHAFDVILLAAGSGSRFSADYPKQYALVQNKTVLEHSLQTLLSLPSVNRLILVLSEQDAIFPTLNINHSKIKKIVGGAERAYSVFNALNHVDYEESEWVLVHDAARCCVRSETILKLIAKCYLEKTGGILGAPVKDSIKQVHGYFIEKNIPRNDLYLAQTPQFFLRKELQAAYQQAFDQNIIPTDEASAMELLGKKILLVEGDVDNIKITYPIDLVFAEAIISRDSKD